MHYREQLQAYPTQHEQNTATTSLGHLLTKGSYYGGGSHGPTPSGTSRYNSVDIGLIHLVNLDLSPGPNPNNQGHGGMLINSSTIWALWNNTEGGRGPSAQGQWLKHDLAAAHANRAKVPWIIVVRF